MDDFFRSISNNLNQKQRFVLICDKHVYALYGHKIKGCFNAVDVILIPRGEFCKTRQIKEYVEDRLLDLNLTKQDALVAFGGGAVLDLVGFIASTYMRGVDYYSIPTTLLAMVDACIGGKTAINHPKGKNLIGAFYMPKEVFTSPLFLHSLSKSQIQDAMAEVIKYGIIADATILNQLDLNFSDLIIRCQSIKKSIVSEDHKDHSIRNTLNFGHTIGHAIESLCKYSLTHGQAISIGICMELEICKQLYSFCSKSLDYICHLLESFNLPTKLKSLELQDVLDQCLFDKKAGVNARFVITSKLGTCLPFDGSYLKEISKSEILGVLCVS